MGDGEEYFPRGGKKPTTIRFKQASNFLGEVTHEGSKKKKLKKTPENDDGYLSDELITEVDTSFKTCGLWLNYKVVREGLTMLGRVREVLDTRLHISLPCRMGGVLMACHISEAYNKMLEAYINDKHDKVTELSTIFRRGQYVAVKVLEVGQDRLMLTMMPQHINYGKMHTSLKKGTLLQAAIESVEDHGYIMDIGVPNTKVFLPKKSTNPELHLETGAICWVVIRSVSSSPDSCVVTVSNELERLQQAFQRSPTVSLLPGTAVDFTVNKALDNGIEGHIFDDLTAYIQRQHVEKLRGKKPKLGQKVRARLLYTVPPHNIPFLTMRGIFDTTYPDLEEEQKLNDGEIVEDAQVIKIMSRSVYLKLGDGALGLLSLRRVAVHEDLEDEEVIAKSYPIGSSVTVRVLCYSLADYLYSVSDEPAVLAEKYFKLSEIKIGQYVTATITEVTDRCLKASVGRLKGVVLQSHITEAGYLEDRKKASASLISKKFKIDQTVKARVLSVDYSKNNMLLTLKSSLMDPELEVLSEYEQAKVGAVYTGVVAYIRDYVLVSFFNNVTAYIPRIFVSAEPIDNLADAFHMGQIVKCTILCVKPEEKKMSGSLISKNDYKKTNKKELNVEVTETEKDKNEEGTPSHEKKKKKKRKNTLIDNDDCAPKKQKLNTDESTSKVNIVNTEENNKEKKKRKQLTSLPNDRNTTETEVKECAEILTPEDLSLIDFSDCESVKSYKKRVVTLMKSVKARSSRLHKIKKKILGIEKSGLNTHNKKYHTAMHMEKLVLEERINKLTEALTKGQQKLKELGVDFKSNFIKEEEEKETDLVENQSQNHLKKKKLDNKETKNREVNILDSLQPVVEVPSVKSFWSTDENTLDNLSNNKVEAAESSEEEEEEKPKKKRKKLTPAEKVAKAREEEERIRERERRAIESEGQPRSSEQFHRALLDKPDCSQLWIAYMTFHLQAAEIDKARAVARKALATINFREEQERLNVWLTLLNTEHRFGTQESQQKVLEEALQMNDTYKVHSYLLGLLVDTSKHQELLKLVEIMIRKYRTSTDMYCACGSACYSAGLLEQARRVMQKGIAALEKKEHVNLLVQFAKLERSAGEKERSEALFEQVLAVYPQRVDVASVYLDLLIKGGEAERARQVMERLTSLQLPARKMKILYKKWIEVEEKIGNAEHIEIARHRAKKYLENAQF